MGLLEKLIPPMGRARFAKRALARLRAQDPQCPFSIDEKEFVLRDEENKHFLNLSNFYAEYCRQPLLGRQAIFAKIAALYSRDGGSKPLSLEHDVGSILPRLRHRSYIELTSLHLSQMSHSVNVPHRVIGDELAFELVLDTPESCLTLGDQQLKELGRSFEQLWPVARDNLYRLSVGAFTEVQPGIYASPFQDSHDASRLVLPDLLQDLRVNGPIIAAPVRPELVLFCGKNDAAALLGIAKVVADSLQAGGRTITGQMFELHGDQWRRLRLPTDHPAYWPLRKCELIDAATNYNEQKNLLDKQLEKEGRDCYVGQFDVTGYEDSPVIWSWAAWVEGVTDALMPKTDVVILGFEGEPRQFKHVLWDDLVRVCGHRMHTEGGALSRYHLTSFPSTQELAEITFIDREAIPDRLRVGREPTVE